jgi:hypothetical protein
MVYQIGEKRGDWTFLRLGESEVVIEFRKNAEPKARWTVTEDGPKFEKIGR